LEETFGVTAISTMFFVNEEGIKKKKKRTNLNEWLEMTAVRGGQKPLLDLTFFL